MPWDGKKSKTSQQGQMKPAHLLCYSTLLLRSFRVLHTLVVPFQSDSGKSCTRPSFPWTGYSAQSSFQDTVRHSPYRTLSSMLHQDPGYAKHNVTRLTDLLANTSTEPMDVVVAGQRHEAKEHVIFFGGDVQDYPENMQSHRDNSKYIRWNSMSTAGRLCERFPTAMVLVMKPHHMHLKTFSVYSQFVQSNDFGTPTHSPDFGAWNTLVQVYEEAVGIALGPTQDAHSSSGHQNSNSVPSKPGTDTDKSSSGSGDTETSSSQPSHNTGPQQTGTVADKEPHPVATIIPEVSIHLIGFSKGCIVLNQLVYELESVKSNERVLNFIARIQAMTWLDGGHNDSSNTWVTDQAALGRLAALGIDIHVHVTPYQVKDPMRRWIGKEKKRFVEILLKGGAKVTDKIHFEDEPESIDNHFRVLEVF